jgi:hypothetical protein
MRGSIIHLAAAGFLAVTAIPAAAQQSDDADLVELMRGTWKIVKDDGEIAQDCDNGQHFEPSPDGRHILLTQAGTELSSNYLVIHSEGRRLLLFIEGEDRLTDEGDPVLWWAYFKGPDRFVWRRYDWPRNNATAAEWARCEAESTE